MPFTLEDLLNDGEMLDGEAQASPSSPSNDLKERLKAQLRDSFGVDEVKPADEPKPTKSITPKVKEASVVGTEASEASPEQKHYRELLGSEWLPWLAAQGVRIGGGLLSAEGGLPGAAISGASEGLAQKIESSDPIDAGKVAIEAGIGAIPFGKIVKGIKPTISVGEQLAANAGRMAGYVEGGNMLRRLYDESGKDAQGNFHLGNPLPMTKRDLLMDLGTTVVGAKLANLHPRFDSFAGTEGRSVSSAVNDLSDALANQTPATAAELEPRLIKATEARGKAGKLGGRTVTPSDVAGVDSLEPTADTLGGAYDTSVSPTKGLRVKATEQPTLRAEDVAGRSVELPSDPLEYANQTNVASVEGKRLPQNVELALNAVDKRTSRVPQEWLDDEGRPINDRAAAILAQEDASKELAKRNIMERYYASVEDKPEDRLLKTEAQADREQMRNQMGSTDLSKIKTAEEKAAAEAEEDRLKQLRDVEKSHQQANDLIAKEQIAKEKAFNQAMGERVDVEKAQQTANDMLEKEDRQARAQAAIDRALEEMEPGNPSVTEVTERVPTASGTQTMRQSYFPKREEGDLDGAGVEIEPTPKAPKGNAVNPRPVITKTDPTVVAKSTYSTQFDALNALAGSGQHGNVERLGRGKWRVVFEKEPTAVEAKPTTAEAPAAEETPLRGESGEVNPTPKATPETNAAKIESEVNQPTNGVPPEEPPAAAPVTKPQPKPKGPAPAAVQPEGGAAPAAQITSDGRYSLTQRSQDGAWAIVDNKTGRMVGFDKSREVVQPQFDGLETKATSKSAKVKASTAPESPIGRMTPDEVDAVTREDVQKWTPDEISSAQQKFAKDKRLQGILSDELERRKNTPPSEEPPAATPVQPEPKSPAPASPAAAEPEVPRKKVPEDKTPVGGQRLIVRVDKAGNASVVVGTDAEGMSRVYDSWKDTPGVIKVGSNGKLPATMTKSGLIRFISDRYNVDPEKINFEFHGKEPKVEASVAEPKVPSTKAEVAPEAPKTPVETPATVGKGEGRGVPAEAPAEAPKAVPEAIRDEPIEPTAEMAAEARTTSKMKPEELQVEEPKVEPKLGMRVGKKASLGATETKIVARKDLEKAVSDAKLAGKDVSIKLEDANANTWKVETGPAGSIEKSKEPLTREEFLKRVGDPAETRAKANMLEDRAQALWDSIKKDLYLYRKDGKVKGTNPNKSAETIAGQAEHGRLLLEAQDLQRQASRQEMVHKDPYSHTRSDTVKQYGFDPNRIPEIDPSETPSAKADRAQQQEAARAAKEKSVSLSAASTHENVDIAGAKNGTEVSDRTVAAMKKYRAEVEKAEADTGVDEKGKVVRNTSLPASRAFHVGDTTFTLNPDLNQIDNAIKRIGGAEGRSAMKGVAGDRAPQLTERQKLGFESPGANKPIIVSADDAKALQLEHADIVAHNERVGPTSADKTHTPNAITVKRVDINDIPEDATHYIYRQLGEKDGGAASILVGDEKSLNAVGAQAKREGLSRLNADPIPEGVSIKAKIQELFDKGKLDPEKTTIGVATSKGTFEPLPEEPPPTGGGAKPAPKKVGLRVKGKAAKTPVAAEPKANGEASAQLKGNEPETYLIDRTTNRKGVSQYVESVDSDGNPSWTTEPSKAAKLTRGQVAQTVDSVGENIRIRKSDYSGEVHPTEVRGYVGQDANDNAIYDSNKAWKKGGIDVDMPKPSVPLTKDGLTKAQVLERHGIDPSTSSADLEAHQQAAEEEYGRLKDIAKTDKSPEAAAALRTAGAKLGNLRAAAKLAAQEEGKIASGAVEKGAEATSVAPDKQESAIRDMASKIKTKAKDALVDESGAVRPAIAARMGLSAVGALAGAATTPDDPFTGAMLGGAAGWYGPAVFRAMADHIRSMPKGKAQEQSEKALGEWFHDRLKGLAETLPDYYRASYLSKIPNLMMNSFVGPYGAAVMGALEHSLSGDARGTRALRELANPYKFVKGFFNEGLSESRKIVTAAEERGDVTSNLGHGLKKEIVTAPATLMTAGDVTARRILMRAGFTETEARRLTLTSEPLSDMATSLGAFRKAKGKVSGKVSWMAKMALPFYRTNANQIEQSLLRTPLGLSLRKSWNLAPQSVRATAVQFGLTGVVGAGAFALGTQTSAKAAPFVYKFLTNFGGVYGSTAGVAFLTGVAYQKKGAIEDSIPSGMMQFLKRDAPMPTADALTGWARFVFSDMPKAVGAVAQGRAPKITSLPYGTIPAPLSSKELVSVPTLERYASGDEKFDRPTKDEYSVFVPFVDKPKLTPGPKTDYQIRQEKIKAFEARQRKQAKENAGYEQ